MQRKGIVCKIPQNEKAAPFIYEKNVFFSAVQVRQRGSPHSAAADGVVRDPVRFVVETIFRLRVGNINFCAGGKICKIESLVMALKEAGEFCNRMRTSVDGPVQYKFRFFKVASLSLSVTPNVSR